MRLAHLRSFFAVARHGGFTAGARALHVSQPTVTAQVRALEETYGIELFVRNGRRVGVVLMPGSLTPPRRAWRADPPLSGGGKSQVTQAEATYFFAAA